MQGLWECRSDDVAQLEEGGQEEFGSDQVSGETFVGLSSTSESGPRFKKGVAGSGWLWYWGRSRRLAAASRIHHQ